MPFYKKNSGPAVRLEGRKESSLRGFPWRGRRGHPFGGLGGLLYCEREKRPKKKRTTIRRRFNI